MSLRRARTGDRPSLREQPGPGSAQRRADRVSIRGLVRQTDGDEVIEALEEAESPAPLRTPDELTRAPGTAARGRWRRSGRRGGDIDELLQTVQAAGQEPVMGPVPAFGEHTEAIRAEFGAVARKAPGRISQPERMGGPGPAARAGSWPLALAGQMTASARSTFPPRDFMISSSLSRRGQARRDVVESLAGVLTAPSTLLHDRVVPDPADTGCPSRPAKVRCRPTWVSVEGCRGRSRRGQVRPDRRSSGSCPLTDGDRVACGAGRR